MYPFDSFGGRVALGVAAASLGGMILTALMQQTQDPKQLQMLQLALVFWLIFVGKTTLAYLRTVGSGKVAAAPAGGARRGVEPAPADSSGTPEEPARRRRTRRD